MTRPQEYFILALLSTATGLTTAPRCRCYKESTALRYQEDYFVDVEILSHQKMDILRRYPSSPEEDEDQSIEIKSAYREIRIPLEWYPESSNHSDSTTRQSQNECSKFLQNECQEVKSKVTVRVLNWKKQPGDVVTQGDTMVILEKARHDEYGRIVDQQRIEVASKEDGILKSVLIPQNEELKLKKYISGSLLALFEPSSFHCVDIDEGTRMDMALLADQITHLNTTEDDGSKSVQIVTDEEEAGELTPSRTTAIIEEKEESYHAETDLNPKKDEESLIADEDDEELTPLCTTATTEEKEVIHCSETDFTVEGKIKEMSFNSTAEVSEFVSQKEKEEEGQVAEVSVCEPCKEDPQATLESEKSTFREGRQQDRNTTDRKEKPFSPRDRDEEQNDGLRKKNSRRRRKRGVVLTAIVDFFSDTFHKKF